MPDLPLGVQPEPLIPTPAPPEPEPPASRDPQRRLLDDLKKSKEKYRALEVAAAAAGVDVADPVGYMARREAEARSKADREVRVRDAIKDFLLDGGHKLDRKLRDVVIQAAVGDSSVAVDEKGDLCGVPEYVDGWLASLNSGGPNARPTTPTPFRPAPPLPVTGRAENARDATPKGPATFNELANQGPAAVKAYEAKNPAHFAELKAAHVQALQNPVRAQPPK